MDSIACFTATIFASFAVELADGCFLTVTPPIRLGVRSAFMSVIRTSGGVWYMVQSKNR
jgi:hypothetical protein